jgi:hypothetical protein
MNRPVRRQATYLPAWLPLLDAIGRVTSFKVVPKVGHEVSVEVPTGEEKHLLTVRVPTRFDAIRRYAFALKRVAQALEADLPPPQRKMFEEDPNRV